MSTPIEQFDVFPTSLQDLYSIVRRRRGDSRGFFSRFFCSEDLAALGFGPRIAQINHTLTAKRGSVRGLHFQCPPHAEVKFVSCLRGAVFDVAVDLRRGSSTFLKWHGEILSAENGHSLMIPKGFAHGFQTLEDDCELLYLHSDFYAPGAEGALNVSDPSLGIEWPLEIVELSDRDLSHAPIDSSFDGIRQ